MLVARGIPSFLCVAFASMPDPLNATSFSALHLLPCQILGLQHRSQEAVGAAVSITEYGNKTSCLPFLHTICLHQPKLRSIQCTVLGVHAIPSSFQGTVHDRMHDMSAWRTVVTFA